MRKYLSVEVEHTRYARFLPLDKAGENRISLTTLADFQKRAEVKIYLINQDKPTLLHVFDIERLPNKQAGEPRMGLKGKYDGKGNVQLSISVDGRHYSSKSLSIRKYIRERVLWPWILLLALILLGTAAWLLLRGCSSAGLARSERETAARTTEQSITEPAAETEAVQAEAETEAPADQQPTETNAETNAENSTAETAAETVSTEATRSAETEPPQAPDLSQQVYFGPDSSDLTPEARRELSQFIRELQKYEGVKLQIEGHCALYGTEQGREELSFDRAQRVAQYFRELGYQFDAEPVVRGRGGDEPVSRQNDQQHLNRRVEIRTIPADSNT